jgi:hypothetical protein
MVRADRVAFASAAVAAVWITMEDLMIARSDVSSASQPRIGGQARNPL